MPSILRIIICSAMSPDALNAASMNVHPGGKQPLMRPGWFRRGPLKIKQNMVFVDGPNNGLAKGLRVFCQERFGESSIQGKGLFKYNVVS